MLFPMTLSDLWGQYVEKYSISHLKSYGNYNDQNSCLSCYLYCCIRTEGLLKVRGGVAYLGLTVGYKTRQALASQKNFDCTP